MADNLSSPSSTTAQASQAAAKRSPAPVELDLLLPDSVATSQPLPAESASFDASATTQFQARMSRAPVWFCSFLASNHRENRRFRDELVQIKGAWPLLMKQRNGGGKWTAEDKIKLKSMVRSASSVSPYLFIWAIPGSMLLLPFLAWFLDRQRKNRAKTQD